MIVFVIFRADCDIRMSGHVTWVGSSSAESSLQLEQLVDGEWKRFTSHNCYFAKVRRFLTLPILNLCAHFEKIILRCICIKGAQRPPLSWWPETLSTGAVPSSTRWRWSGRRRRSFSSWARRTKLGEQLVALLCNNLTLAKMQEVSDISGLPFQSPTPRRWAGMILKETIFRLQFYCRKSFMTSFSTPSTTRPCHSKQGKKMSENYWAL